MKKVSDNVKDAISTILNENTLTWIQTQNMPEEQAEYLVQNLVENEFYISKMLVYVIVEDMELEQPQ